MTTVPGRAGAPVPSNIRPPTNTMRPLWSLYPLDCGTRRRLSEVSVAGVYHGLRSYGLEVCAWAVAGTAVATMVATVVATTIASSGLPERRIGFMDTPTMRWLRATSGP